MKTEEQKQNLLKLADGIEPFLPEIMESLYTERKAVKRHMLECESHVEVE